MRSSSTRHGGALSLLLLLASLSVAQPAEGGQAAPPPSRHETLLLQAEQAMQEEDTISAEAREQRDLEQEIDTIVITAMRRPAEMFEVPRGLNLVPKSTIRTRPILSVADAAQDQIGVWVEKRTATTSDFVIRGLSGGNLLALVDMNTLSTFWGEGGFAGDDMYGKIDPETVERIEIIRGPASVLYGSNALGGVVNFISRHSPFDFTEEGYQLGSRSRVTVSSAPSMWRFRQEFYGASENLRWLFGASSWDAGKTRDGGGQDQEPTGGDGWFADAALDLKVGDAGVLSATIQHADNRHVYRYYRPNQQNENQRTAVALSLALDELDWGIADEALFRIYVQDKEDRREWFDGATGLQTASGVAKWWTVQGGVQLNRALDDHLITYGFDFQTTWGESPDDEQFTVTPTGGNPMKASPDTIWSSIGGYVQDEWAVTDWLSLVGSIRFDALRFESDVDDQYNPPGGLDPQVDEFTDWETALVGGLQAIFHVTPEMNIYGGWTRGFRQFAPKFGVTQHGYGVLVPSELLDPVTADQFEVGAKYRSRWWTADAVAYYTWFDNFQNAVRGSWQGQDWYDYNGDGIRDLDEDVYELTGDGEAEVFGVEIEASMNFALISEDFFGECWSIRGGFMWNYGRDETNDIPVRHTHPARGLVTLRYDYPDPHLQLWAEFAAEFVRHYDRIPPSRLSGDVGYLEDPQDPTSGMRRSWGLPGYSVFNFRAGFRPCEHATLAFGVDNIFDKLYRSAHSRWDAPGRNFWVSLEMTF